MQVVGQILLIPDMVLNLLQGDTLHWVWLQHSVDQVLNLWREVIWNVIPAFFDLAEQLRHLVVVEG